MFKMQQTQFALMYLDEVVNQGNMEVTSQFSKTKPWTTLQKSKFIETILLRISLPCFYFAQNNIGELTLIDGYQRVQTILEFMHNKFPVTNLSPVTKECENLYYKTNESSGQKGLPEDYYRWFNMTQVSANILENYNPNNPAPAQEIYNRLHTP